MITETREIYKCEYCRKLYQLKPAALKHEIVCTKNPDNYRPCLNCDHLEKRDTEIYGEHYNGVEWERTISLLYCTDKNTFLYPPSVEYKGNHYELFDESNNPMPTTCEIYDKEQKTMESIGNMLWIK